MNSTVTPPPERCMIYLHPYCTYKQSLAGRAKCWRSPFNPCSLPYGFSSGSDLAEWQTASDDTKHDWIVGPPHMSLARFDIFLLGAGKHFNISCQSVGLLTGFPREGICQVWLLHQPVLIPCCGHVLIEILRTWGRTPTSWLSATARIIEFDWCPKVIWTSLATKIKARTR